MAQSVAIYDANYAYILLNNYTFIDLRPYSIIPLCMYAGMYIYNYITAHLYTYAMAYYYTYAIILVITSHSIFHIFYSNTVIPRLFTLQSYGKPDRLQEPGTIAPISLNFFRKAFHDLLHKSGIPEKLLRYFLAFCPIGSPYFIARKKA